MKRYSKAWWLHAFYFVAVYAECLALAVVIVFCMVAVLAAADGAIDWPTRP